MWVGGLMYFVSDRGERHLQPLHPEARHQGRRSGHEVRRLRRHDGPRRTAGPSSTSRTAGSTSSTSRRARTRASPSRSPPTAGPCATGSSTRATTSTRPASATTARPSSWRPAATSSASPPGRGAAENLSGTPGTREIYPALSPDGKTVAFFSDKSGDYQLYTQPRRRRRLDARHDRPRPDRLQAPLVARREEDPLRQQGLLRSSASTSRRRSWSRSTPPTR